MVVLGGAFAPSRLPSRAASALQVHHARNRASSPLSNREIDHDLFLHVHEAVENLRQGDALHVRAQITWPHELDIWQLGLHIVSHRAFRDRDDTPWLVLA